MARRYFTIWDILVMAISWEMYVESLGGKLDVKLDTLRVDPETGTGYVDAVLSPPMTLNHIKVDIVV